MFGSGTHPAHIRLRMRRHDPGKVRRRQRERAFTSERKVQRAEKMLLLAQLPGAGCTLFDVLLELRAHGFRQLTVKVSGDLFALAAH